MTRDTSVLQRSFCVPGGAAHNSINVADLPPRCRALKHMIGNTPLLAIRFLYRGRARVIYAKAEHLNLTGSIKDDNKKYLTTDLLREERSQPGYITPQVELLSYEAIKRVCYTCFDEED